MKRLLIIVCLMLFCTLNCFGANYKLAPEYKTEIENTINSRYPYVVSEINVIAFKANKMYNQVLKNKDLYMDFAAENFDMQIDGPEFYLYSDLIKITDKYSKIDKNKQSTDFSGVLYNILLPYFEANNIDRKKIDMLGLLSGAKLKEINTYYENLHKFVYNE